MFKNFKNKCLAKPPSAQKGEINHTAIDRFTLVHFSIGLVYGLFGLGFWIVLFFAVVWEIIENPLKANFQSAFPRGTADTLQNAVVDCIAVILGWALVSHMVNVT